MIHFLHHRITFPNTVLKGKLTICNWLLCGKNNGCNFPPFFIHADCKINWFWDKLSNSFWNWKFGASFGSWLTRRLCRTSLSIPQYWTSNKDELTNHTSHCTIMIGCLKLIFLVDNCCSCTHQIMACNFWAVLLFKAIV